MTEQYQSLEEKPYESHYLFEEIDIDAPPETVWPFAIAIGNWMDTHVLETVDGRQGEVGHFERVHPHGLGDDVPQPHHHVYGVAFLVPNRYIGLEVLPERGGSYGSSREYISLDGLQLVDRGDGTTRATFLMIDCQMGKDPEATAERWALIDAAHDQISGSLKKLKQQAEAAK